MSYLSRRCREIRQEEEGQWIPIKSLSVGRIYAGDLVYSPMAMVDPGMQRLQDLAYERYEQTMAARNPRLTPYRADGTLDHVRAINFRNRGG